MTDIDEIASITLPLIAGVIVLVIVPLILLSDWLGWLPGLAVYLAIATLIARVTVRVAQYRLDYTECQCQCPYCGRYSR